MVGGRRDKSRPIGVVGVIPIVRFDQLMATREKRMIKSNQRGSVGRGRKTICITGWVVKVKDKSQPNQSEQGKRKLKSEKRGKRKELKRRHKSRQSPPDGCRLFFFCRAFFFSSSGSCEADDSVGKLAKEKKNDVVQKKSRTEDGQASRGVTWFEHSGFKVACKLTFISNQSGRC